MNIDSKELIGGIPSLIARNVCRWVKKGLSELEIVERLQEGVKNPKKAIGRLAKAGYLKRLEGPNGPELELTKSGRRLAVASAAKSIHRITADENLVGFLERVEEVNRNPYYLYYVKEVRLFGSYLDPSRGRLGDIDVALELAAKDSGQALSSRVMQRAADAEKEGRHFKTFFDRLSYGEIEVKRFLKGRSTSLKLHSPDDAVLRFCKQRVIFRIGGQKPHPKKSST